MKIAVFGTGYVGLVAGVCFADAGNHVVGIDIDSEKIRGLQDGKVPIYEPGLEELLKSSLKAKRIEFTTDPAKGIEGSQIIFVAVGTPEGEDGSADLKYILNVVKVIAESMNDEKIIVLKSTVPVGTAEKVEKLLGQAARAPFHVVSNPEFLKEGTSLDDFFKPDRVVIGCQSEYAREIMAELYAPFVRSGNPILFMSNKSAELTKYAANAFLATKISFINELALLSDLIGADINEVRKGFTTDSRINPAFFYPGIGYGGSCFPKDVKALAMIGKESGVPMDLVLATEKVNQNQKIEIFKKIKAHYENLKNLKIAFWGLSFKPRTDDVREAPAFAIINALLKEGAVISAYDPAAMSNSKKHFGNKITFASSAYEALNGCDGLVVATEWNEFRSPDFEEVKKRLKQSVIFDGRNIFETHHMRKLGFTYYCIGRQSV